MQICKWYHKNLKFSENRNLFDNYISDTFTVSAKYDNADTWFLLLISAIWAECSFDSVAGSGVLRHSVANSRRRDVLAVVFRPIRIDSGKGLSNSIVDGARRFGVAPGKGTAVAVPDGPDGFARFGTLPFPTAMRVIGTAAGASGH